MAKKPEISAYEKDAWENALNALNLCPAIPGQPNLVSELYMNLKGSLILAGYKVMRDPQDGKIKVGVI